VAFFFKGFRSTLKSSAKQSKRASEAMRISGFESASLEIWSAMLPAGLQRGEEWRGDLRRVTVPRGDWAGAGDSDMTSQI